MLDGKGPVQDFFPENGGKELAPFLRKLESKRKVSFTDVTADPFTFSLSLSGDRKPCCLKTDKLATYTVTGVKEAIERYGKPGKVVLQFTVDLSGMVHLSKADTTVEVEETIEVDKMVPDEDAGAVILAEENDAMCITAQSACCWLLACCQLPCMQLAVFLISVKLLFCG